MSGSIKYFENRSSPTDISVDDLYDLFRTLIDALSQLQNTNRDILSLIEACALLHCSEDTLRRIPTNELPIYRVGKSNLYFLEDIKVFVRSRCVTRASTVTRDEIAQDVDVLFDDVLSSATVDVREPSRRRLK